MVGYPPGSQYWSSQLSPLYATTVVVNPIFFLIWSFSAMNSSAFPSSMIFLHLARPTSNSSLVAMAQVLQSKMYNHILSNGTNNSVIHKTSAHSMYICTCASIMYCTYIRLCLKHNYIHKCCCCVHMVEVADSDCTLKVAEEWYCSYIRMYVSLYVSRILYRALCPM